MADGSEDGVDGIAGGSLEIAAAEMALGFYMADHGLYGGAATQLALDGTEQRGPSYAYHLEHGAPPKKN